MAKNKTEAKLSVTVTIEKNNIANGALALLRFHRQHRDCKTRLSLISYIATTSKLTETRAVR